MKKIYIIYLVILSIFSGCDKEWLEIQPKGVLIPTAVNDYRLLLDQVEPGRYGDKISPGFATGYSNTDLMSDDFPMSDFNDEHYFGVTDVRRGTWADNIFELNEEDPDWKNLYGQIYPANITIEEVMTATNGTEAEKLQLLAEAKVHRAYSYFALVNMYALHYGPDASSTPGVPLRLDSSFKGDLSRVPVQKIYDLMVEDIKASISNLPDVPETRFHSHRPSKVSAYALLARVLLYMGLYDDALDAATESLKIKNTLIDYNVLGFSRNVLRLHDLENDIEVLWRKQTPKIHASLTASDELYNLYEADDLRQRLYIASIDYWGSPEEGYLLPAYTRRNYRGLGFTVAEMLLTRAECNVRLNNTGLAVGDLNLLREKRYITGTHTPITSTDKDEVLDLVKKERRLELAGNGLRFFDLKRYNQFDNANISLTVTHNGTIHTLPPGGNNWAIPIAQKYIVSTPEIGENIRD
ncbi:RagB/SusD family nutrient uptake outer membrane protein [Flavivirga spongiicola]|uniref:RagB/SusD family nutrient uptake outer membrane protein n=1 Tax=Flavivirga spongiicola TaxID=421621 RepID=A0ABU7XX55_9FLAO|nr:RagB/SusD family nutrient uptake outer membrane protein [Flavivirga sp. MEBiC05379]MDO5980352.1 RagB/SusD family nutrient uptake outer membrane protein [Flavivirga sp. MEBiC05379]